jgi:hypothetical protein
MASKLKIQLAHHWTSPEGREHLPGEEISVDGTVGRKLIKAGYATEVTAEKAAAKADSK